MPPTPRIVLRPPRPSDSAEFISLVKASRALHRPWISPPADGAAFAAHLARNRREDFEALLIRTREDDQLVGAFNLSQIFHGPFQNAYLSYWVGAPFAGKGLMSEALNLVLSHAFGALRLHRLEANIQPGNERSIALVRRAGLRLEGFSPRYLKIGGRWRDHERWAITREERRPRVRQLRH